MYWKWFHREANTVDDIRWRETAVRTWEWELMWLEVRVCKPTQRFITVRKHVPINFQLMNESILWFKYKRIVTRISHHIQLRLSQNSTAMFILGKHANWIIISIKCMLVNDFTGSTKMYYFLESCSLFSDLISHMRLM